MSEFKPVDHNGHSLSYPLYRDASVVPVEVDIRVAEFYRVGALFDLVWFVVQPQEESGWGSDFHIVHGRSDDSGFLPCVVALLDGVLKYQSFAVATIAISKEYPKLNVSQLPSPEWSVHEMSFSCLSAAVKFMARVMQEKLGGRKNVRSIYTGPLSNAYFSGVEGVESVSGFDKSIPMPEADNRKPSYDLSDEEYAQRRRRKREAKSQAVAFGIDDGSTVLFAHHKRESLVCDINVVGWLWSEKDGCEDREGEQFKGYILTDGKNPNGIGNQATIRVDEGEVQPDVDILWYTENGAYIGTTVLSESPPEKGKSLPF